MSIAPGLKELSSWLRSRRALLESGMSERAIADACRSGLLRVVRRGWYVENGRWMSLSPESRHLLHAVAVARDGGDGLVLSHVSAAVLWGLPLYRLAPTRVHLTTPAPARISSGPDVLRHVAPLASADVGVRHGIRCTSLARTVFDVLRMASPEAAVSCGDAAERLIALDGREWNQDAVGEWRHDLARRVEEASGARGVRQARWLAPFADGRAQLPGESVSRLQLHRLRFAPPRLQVVVAAPGSGRYDIDFALDDVRAFGEFDGEIKYLDERMRAGRSVERVLLDEKRREDWIRGTTQYRFVRWGAAEAAHPEALARHLAAFHIHPPR
ncbi:hypothetical protein AB0N73_04475 [Microbacterium sp. NPDC089189]|uniref:hypothetical protein n=1 Tax=Microbacterium sp. NPDC089189 TaxID=3154972 RepID=UPI0034235DF3